MTPAALTAVGANLLNKLDRLLIPIKINSVKFTLLNTGLSKGNTMKPTLIENSKTFLAYLEQWNTSLAPLSLEEIAQKPEETAIISVDLIEGFCSIGPLASPRVAGIVEPVTRLMRAAWQHGIRNILLTQDSHEEDAVEFGAFPPHCVRGTREAETVDAIRALPFFDQILLIEKNSIASGLNAGVNQWLEQHPAVNTFIVVGDCTDLCTYQLAMHLRMDANERQRQRRVIVPVNCVETYDRPVATAEAEGGLPHPGDLLHHIFLYHMALNDIEVCREIV